MTFYEIYLELRSGAKRIGMTSLQVKSSSPFIAAREAETTVNRQYGHGISSRTLRVNPISEAEYLYQMAA